MLFRIKKVTQIPVKLTSLLQSNMKRSTHLMILIILT